LGAGTIDTAHCVRLLQAAGYDGTITLEVFTPDRHHLSYSREVLRRVWDECAEERAAARTNPAVVLR
jgi:sugar phosphate isomerase/epimerase